MLRGLFIAMLIISGSVSSGIVRAGPYEDGSDAYARDDYATALRLWRPLAEQGNRDAQTAVGMMYWHGDGVTQDYKEAAKWFRLAAAQGDVMAQSVLGDMYHDGQGVIQDYKEAANWYRLAAEQGNAEAQYNLGVMYEEGQGVIQDLREAVKWIRLSAGQGHALAQENLGFMYVSGQGVRRDIVRAYMWFSLAASKLSGDDGKHATNNRDRAAKILTRAQLAQAQEMARQCQARNFKNCIGGAGPLEDGYNAAEHGDFVTALRLWRPLAEQGDAEAQYNLGVMYEQGQGVIQDYGEAVKWYRLAAEQGDAGSQNNLGVMYAKGRGVPQNYREAVKWYRLAAEQGYPRAQSNLGSMYRQGQGIKQDFKEALKWYRLAAEQGSAEGQYSLGRTYAAGFGRGATEAEDLMRAYMWLNLGASNLIGEAGHEAANHRDDVAKRLTPTQVGRAQEMARQCQSRNFKNCD
jgi:uncharacterized protein